MRVRINNQPTAAQKKVLREECWREFDRLLDAYNRDVSLQVMYILHFDYNFGQDELKQFNKRLIKMQGQMRERYEMPDKNLPWLCELKLVEDGINVEEILNS